MSNSADTVAGLMWDDFRATLNALKDNDQIDRKTYWYLTDLVNDYGYAMKLAGMRGEITDSVERIMNSTMGNLDGVEARNDNAKYNFGG